MSDYPKCPCVPQTDICRASNEASRVYYQKKAVLGQTRDKEHALWDEARFMLEAAEQELKSLLHTGWITQQPGPCAMCLTFTTEDEWRQKVQDIQDLMTVLKAERDQHSLRYQTAGRALNMMQRCGPPGPHGLYYGP